MEPIKTLADFKRWLKTPNATIHGVSHWRLDQMQPEVRKSFLGPRTIRSVQSNGFYTSTGGFMDFGKASGWAFADNVATFTFEDGRQCLQFHMSNPDD